ncbi:EAL and HDOD domain-containing protein [Marinobacterium jannaschii]|uniref:EAL and HDOD domain-containing protein n=1 Tax=Marinobacterium jannaschii TaxID=64970 RepID=UPI000486C0AB|nr:HDOD domain-containing protein [Marinobacterium jannaschii]
MESISSSQVLLARQPIFDARQQVIAYELLYRSEESRDQAIFRDSAATVQVILNTYTSISDGGAVKRLPAFINLTTELLLERSFPELPKKQVVLELPADLEPTLETAKAVQALVQEGYRVALDNYGHDARWAPLLKLAHMVKINVTEQNMERLAADIRQLAEFKVVAIATHIETHEMLDQCHRIGFKLFQGHFLSKPKIVTGRQVSGNSVTLLQLMQALQNPSTKPEELEQLIVRDPVLTYKLLRIINSAAYSLVRKVESVSEAVVLLGMEQIRRWASLITMTQNKDKPEELSRSLLIRGRMCEEIATAQKRPNPGGYFMAGMMSGLHAILDIEQTAMLQEVPIADDIRQAILGFEGDIGQVLQNTINYENGDWDKLPASFDATLYENSYRAGLAWAQEAMMAIAD